MAALQLRNNNDFGGGSKTRANVVWFAFVFDCAKKLKFCSFPNAVIAGMWLQLIAVNVVVPTVIIRAI